MPGENGINRGVSGFRSLYIIYGSREMECVFASGEGLEAAEASGLISLLDAVRGSINRVFPGVVSHRRSGD